MTQQVRNVDGETVNVMDDADQLAFLKKALVLAITVGIGLVASVVLSWAGLDSRLTSVEKAQAQQVQDKKDDKLEREILSGDIRRLVKTMDSLAIVFQGMSEDLRGGGRRR